MSDFPAKVGVIGGGRMGAGIAHGFLTSGSEVIVIEANDDAAKAATERVATSVQKSIDRGLEGSVEDWMGKFSVSTDKADLAGRELVVEAVPEIWDLKVQTLQDAEKNMDETAVLASNTSSLSIDGLAKELSRPGRFLGLHFFNPVPASKLIEVVVGQQTDEELVGAARSWTEGLGKTAVVVKDAPGFASSRLGVALALEAMRMVEAGVASAEDIDNAMVLGYGHASGPLKTTDIVGLDVRLGIAEYLEETLGERFAPPQIMRDMVERGELGMKSGKGFYDWSKK
ncbi:3-hydroxyacyl-CoA dehydrogenase family protein [Pseudoglutamicibacter cumminsii]|uniref:3-hydroxyacyl-CoA dehydrogenase family protein n=1 Tax=Pseudoglutamicibacter cumminsii TaxID=156979 RepID=UPI0021A528A6|nr:3-hydroxyacyl-CoA dehydrogenase family protein [Pseudoglutamicibacter cumminsii]MCT1686948.1 3-hydroxyacyl-CoA dehydrogenase family protein [Pseudoglutamicibacter cumminsii]